MATKTKSAPATRAASNGKKVELGENMTAVLKLISKTPLTIATTMVKSRLSRRAAYHSLFHLRRMGYATSKDTVIEEGHKEFLWIATAKGKKAAA
jgi:hypothetical protein